MSGLMASDWRDTKFQLLTCTERESRLSLVIRLLGQKARCSCVLEGVWLLFVCPCHFSTILRALGWSRDPPLTRLHHSKQVL